MRFSTNIDDNKLLLRPNKIISVFLGTLFVFALPVETSFSQEYKANVIEPETLSVETPTPDSVASPKNPDGKTDGKTDGKNCGQSKKSVKSLRQGTKMVARGGVAAFGISKTGGQAGKHGGAAVAGGANAASGINTAYSGACDAIQDCPASPLNCGLDLTLTGAGAFGATVSTRAAIAELEKRKKLNDDGDTSGIDKQIEDLKKQLSEMEGNVNQQICDLFPDLEDCNFVEDVNKHGIEVASAMYGVDPEIIKTFSKDNGQTLLKTYENAGPDGVKNLLESRLDGRPGFNGPHQGAISASRSGAFDSPSSDSLAGPSQKAEGSKQGSLLSQKKRNSRDLALATGGSFSKENAKKDSSAEDFMKNIQGLLTGLEEKPQNRKPGSIQLKRKTNVATPELQRKEVGLFQLMTQRIQNSPRIRKAFEK
jgi:hypothetical protein